MKTLYAMFDEASLALLAVATLLERGVRTADISIITKDSLVKSGKDEANSDGAGATSKTSSEHQGKMTDRATNGETCLDAVRGAGIGLGVGLTAALVSITIPGFGIVAGGGALATAIAGTASATAAGAVAGAALSYLKEAGIPENTAAELLKAYENGWAIVVVEIPDGALDYDAAELILRRYDAKNINAVDGIATVNA